MRALRARQVDVVTAQDAELMVRRLFRLLAECSAADMHDRLEYLGNWR